MAKVGKKLGGGGRMVEVVGKARRGRVRDGGGGQGEER